MNPEPIIDAVLLLLVANGAPILARNVLGARCERAVDAGRHWRDGRPLLGPTKTWRGLAAAIAACALSAPILGVPAWQGAVIGAAAMLGDLGSSFVKRRRGVASSDSVLLLDQMPEALLPLLFCAAAWPMGVLDLGAALLGFFVLDLILSRILFRWHIRNRPR